MVSVIIPVLNREKLVSRCLESVRTQTYRPLEVIVVDNGSTDKTLESVSNWITSLPGDENISASLLSEPSPGACQARNKGLKNATGEFVIFFDSDDEMMPQLVESAVNGFKKNPETDIVTWKCNINLLDGGKKIPSFNISDPMGNHLIHALLRPQGYMGRRKIFEEAGGWNESLSGWNDWELGVRLLLRNPKVTGIPEVMAQIHAQEDSITGTCFHNKEGVWEKSLEAVRKAVKESTHKDKKNILKTLDYREVILAAIYYRERYLSGAKSLKSGLMKHVAGIDRLLLNFAYHYTRLGGRGAWLLIKPFYLRP